jgi:hypothetical protein
VGGRPRADAVDDGPAPPAVRTTPPGDRSMTGLQQNGRLPDQTV